LPSHADEEKESEGKTYSLATWVELQENGELQVGVYAYCAGRWGTGTTVHDGFLITPDGTIAKMPVQTQLKYI